VTSPREEYARQESELDELYRDIIIDHYRNPRHRGSLTAPSASEEGLNPLCGDEVTVDIALRDGRIADIAYRGSGCSISQSSASMMTEAVHGKPVEETRRLIDMFTAMMRGSDEIDPEALGDLEAMAGVRKFPVRVKCATLAWHTLEEALGRTREGS
jgi:nitrogen fixation NifU-like protein